MTYQQPAFDLEKPVAGYWERMVDRYPDRVAVQRGDRLLTYAELNRTANRLAHGILAARGHGQEPVAMLVEPGISAVVAILGILKAGKAYVALDNTHPIPRLTTILEDSRASLLLCSMASRDRARTLALGQVELLDLDGMEAGLPAENPGQAAGAGALLNVMYTSGSTGRPKGAMQTHRNLLHAVAASMEFSPRNPKDRFLQLTSFSMGASAATMFQTLLTGGRLVIYDLRTDGFDRLADQLVQQEITHTHCVPTVFRHLLAGLKEGQVFPAMRHIALGGEPVYRTDVEKFKRHFLPGCRLRVGFGTTENYLSTRNILDHTSEIASPVVPLGHPVDGVRILILDPAGEPVPDGEVGEIGVQSRFLSPGYWHRPEITEQAYRPDPAGGDERIYLTGDLGRLLPDGSMEHLDRKDRQVKIRGHRVETGEIEVALLECPGVLEAVVSGRQRGKADVALVAYVVLEDGQSSSDLRAALANKLPDYMWPATVMVLDRLPLLPFGKVDLKALPEPGAYLSRPATPFVAPRTPTEESLAAIWCAVLERNTVGVEQNFFELGGNSLLASQVTSRIREELGVDLPLRAIFETPTIASLAIQVLALNGSSAESQKSPGMDEALQRARRLLGPM